MNAEVILNKTKRAKRNRTKPNRAVFEMLRKDVIAAKSRKQKEMKGELIEGSIVGAAGGAAWGTFVGLFLAIGIMSATTTSWAILIGALIIGALIGAILGSLTLWITIRAGFRR